MSEKKYYEVTTNPLEIGPLKASLYLTTDFGSKIGVGSEFIADFETEEKAKGVCAILNQSLKSQPSPAWVKCSNRLPGYETPVKWRDGKDHSHVTDGKIPLIHMAKPFLTGWEWLDESGTAAGREEDAVEFAEWIREAGIEPTFGNKWVDFNKPKDNRYTTEQLYQQFKQQKEK